MLQILPAGNDQGAVRAVVVEGEGLILIEVLNPVPIESGVGGQLLIVEAMANHLVVVDVVRQMADPAAHQIQNLGAGRNPLAIQLRQPSAEAGVEMVNEARLAVEQRVITAIELVALSVLKYTDCCHRSTQLEVPVHQAGQLTNNPFAGGPLPDHSRCEADHGEASVELFNKPERCGVPGTRCGEGLTEALGLLVLKSRPVHGKAQIQRTLTAVPARPG